jgi:two-component system sensor histidine kinase/response regulator
MPMGKPVNILLVDDNAAKRQALAAALEDLGQNLVIAGSSREALQLALQRDYAVLLLDVQMPDMNGFELAALIRSRPRSKNIPIIFITAYSQAEVDALRGYSLGAVDYIYSPVIPEVLRAKVRVFIELAAARERLEAEVTERKRVQEEITALNVELAARAAQLEAANQELESFSYSVSHDLRAPVRAINGFSNILEEEHAGQLDDEGKRLLRIVADQGRTMGHLIDDLLEFSRLGRQPIAAREIDMTALATAVLRDLATDGDYAPAIKLHPLARASGDPALIRQVWINLLWNAIKFSSRRDKPEIEVSSYPNGHHNVFCVKDNGAGFDMQYYDKLFGVFHRLHRAEEFPGTGVGLALVHRVLSRHGGRIWADGKVGKGATFYFALPKA